MILDVTGTSTIPSDGEEDDSTLLVSAAVVLTSPGVFEVVVVFKTTSLLLLASEFIIDSAIKPVVSLFCTSLPSFTVRSMS